MSSSSIDVTLCDLCRRRPGQKEIRNGRLLNLCGSCLARIDLENESNKALLAVGQLLEHNRFDLALRELQRIEDAFIEHDVDGWLAGHLLSMRSQILEAMGDNEQALVAIRMRIALGFGLPSDEALARLASAILLQKVGRGDESAAEVERSLDALERADARAALPMLIRLSRERMASSVGQRSQLVAQALRAAGIDDVDAEHDPLGALERAMGRSPTER